jgi:hypothetical protein
MATTPSPPVRLLIVDDDEALRQALARRFQCLGLAVAEAADGEEGASLIVLGTHGRGPLGKLLLGSVADKVVRGAPCPVLTTNGLANRGAAP